MNKQILVSVPFILALITNSHAVETTPQTRTQVTLQKQFTLNVAGVDLKALDPAVKRARVECRIQMQDASHFDAKVLASAYADFPVSQQPVYGGSVQSGPIAFSLNVGDGFHNAPESAGPRDAHKWRCRLQLEVQFPQGLQWENVESGSDSYCSRGYRPYACGLSGAPWMGKAQGDF